MKKVFVVLFLNMWILLIFAQHKIGVNVGGMTTYQFDNVDITTSKLGYGGELGVIYQFQKNRFLFQTGLSADYSVSMLALDSIGQSQDMLDANGLPFTYHSMIYDRTDRADVLEVSLPLMLGFKVSSFHALFGAELGYPLSEQTTQAAFLTSTADYNGMFYEEFENMPQHGYVNDISIETKSDVDFMYDVRACVELGGGWNLSKSTKKNKGMVPQLAVGVFAEYGLLNALKTGDNALVVIDNSQPQNSKLNHVYSTKLPTNASVNNLRIGLRVAILFPVAGEGSGRKNKKCMCIDYIYRKHPAYRKRR